MALDFIDDDTLQAVRNLWLKEGNPVAGLVPVPLQAGQPRSGQAKIYAIADCKKQQEPRWYTGGIFLDFRRITITFYGPKILVTQAVNAALTIYNRQTILTFPSGSKFCGWIPGDMKLQEDPGQRQGDDVWQGILEAEIWSSRKAS